MVQETLIRLVHKVESGAFKSEKGSLAMYAFGIAHYVRLEFSKEKKHLGLEVVKEESDESLESDYLSKERQNILRRAIQQLPADQQNVVSLLLDRELKLNEIGIILNIPVGTVKSHVHRAKSQLKIEIEKIGGLHV